jgi:hypothetical protein
LVFHFTGSAREHQSLDRDFDHSAAKHRQAEQRTGDVVQHYRNAGFAAIDAVATLLDRWADYGRALGGILALSSSTPPSCAVTVKFNVTRN